MFNINCCWVLRLVHYQNKARLRLDYLSQLKVRCASLHILSCGSEAFANKRIGEKLQQLHSYEFLEELQINNSNHTLNNNEKLTLVLYFIESEFHFTGDGIWTEQHTQNVENFNNLLPDFPESINKIYKYGIKPATSQESLNCSAEQYIVNN